MPIVYGRLMGREHPAKDLIRAAREEVVSRLETASTNDPETFEMLAELRALRRIRAQIAQSSEQAREAFGVAEGDIA